MDYMIRMRGLREDNDYSQKFVADYLMVSQSVYSRYEIGDRKIPVESLMKLAKLYDVSMDYLCGLTNSKGTYPQK